MMQGVDYTLVICTYNPDERILTRCLKAVLDLDRSNIITETILVDNNSKLPVSDLNYVQHYINLIPSARTILVKEQGVQFARMAAIGEAKGKYIVYFDYDNEPENNYLQELQQLHLQYNNVAAWGPGVVQVDFIDGIDPVIKAYAKGAFQERHNTNIEYASEKEWQACYPFGTGLCTKAEILKEYVSIAKQGGFTLPGRKGKLLTSGEDTQMVLLCIKKGYAAGVAPELKLKHIISANRANTQYLIRLIYGTYVCYETCLIQVFPEKKNELENKILPPIKFAGKAIKKYLKARFKKNPHKTFDAVQFIAITAGAYMALQKALPLIISRILRKLNVE